MKKKQDENLRKKGFAPVDEYLYENVISFCGRGEYNYAAMEHMLEAMRYYEEASKKFHSPGGSGFYIVQQCLQKYLDYKFMRQNNHFRFSDFEEEGQECDYKFISVKRKKEPILNGSRADIYYLLNQADQTSAAARRCEDYVSSNRLHLTSVLIRLIEHTVLSMEQHSSKRLRSYGKFLRTVYMSEASAELEVGELFSLLELTKKQYYRIRSEAITFLSESLFGILAGENGMAELYIRDSEIIVPSIYR